MGKKMMELTFAFSPVAWIAALFLAVVFTFFAYRITNPPLTGLRRWTLILLRFIAFLAIFLMIVEPLAAWVRAREIEPKVVVLWDNSRSMALSDKSGDRAAIVRSLSDSEAMSKIRAEHDVEEYLFSDSATVRDGDFTFDGDVTATGRAISKIRRATNDIPIGVLVLVSDGEANYGEDPFGAAYRSDFPILTIGVGDPTPPKDVVVRQLTAQRLAFVDQQFPIIAGIGSFGYSGRESMARLYRGDEKIDEKRIVLAGSGELVDVTFEVTPDTAGVFTYRVVVPSLAGELTASNNSRSVRVEILPGKRSILVVGSEPNWEMTFLLRALRSDPDIVVETAFTGKSSGAGDVRLPKNVAGFSEFDAVILVDLLGDFDAMGLGPVLLDYVRGGGAVSFHILSEIILNRVSGKVWADMFPFIYSAGSHVWTTDEFIPELTVQGLIHPITRVSESVSSQVDGYDRLPPLGGFAMVTGTMPGAEILMTHPRLDDVPIIAMREVGRGRVTMFNGAGFWRWGFLPFGFGGNAKLYRGLVSRDAAWLLAAGEGSAFIIETDKRVYRSGEGVILDARLRDESNKPLGGARVSAVVACTDSAADSLAIVLEDRGNGIYISEMPAFGVGKWRISARAELDDQTIGYAANSFLVEPYSIEMENVRLNIEGMRGIAEATGGRYLDASDIDSLPDFIKTPKLIRNERRERAFWDHPLLLVIFVLSICGEWLLRKRWDLP